MGLVALALKILAAIAFLLAGVNEDIFDQGPADLVAWGLLFWVVSELLGGVVTLGTEAWSRR